MNARDKTRIATAALVIGMAQLCRSATAPKTVCDMVARIEQRGHAALDTLPDPTDKEARSINRRIHALGTEIASKGISSVALSSFLLAAVEDVLPGMHQQPRAAFSALHSAMRRLHNYYDRTLRHTDHYRAADQLASWWRQAA